MSARDLPCARPSAWHSSVSPISTAISSTRTDDPLASVRTLPMPTLNLVFGGKAHGDLTLTRAATTRPVKAPHPIAALEPSSPPAASGPAYCPVDPQNAAPAHPHRIELSIDSLANHLLIEPIPVAIDPIGDSAYTAWVHNLDTNATGHTVVEALLMLKERIEAVYEDLNTRAHLDAEQKTTLQMLHTYIAPKKPEWV